MVAEVPNRNQIKPRFYDGSKLGRLIVEPLFKLISFQDFERLAHVNECAAYRTICQRASSDLRVVGTGPNRSQEDGTSQKSLA